MIITLKLSVSECSDNINISHSLDSYSKSVSLNESTSVSFQCIYNVAHAVSITYTWYVNGVVSKQGSNEFDYRFGEGEYTVTCEAGYQLLTCPPCSRSTSVSVTISGMLLFSTTVRVFLDGFLTERCHCFANFRYCHSTLAVCPSSTLSVYDTSVLWQSH